MLKSFGQSNRTNIQTVQTFQGGSHQHGENIARALKEVDAALSTAESALQRASQSLHRVETI